jgi:hypothetical protein
MMKFGFKIRTRDGSTVDNLVIPGRDQVEAEAKLRQVYRASTVLEVRVLSGATTPSATDLETLITFIAADDHKP